LIYQVIVGLVSPTYLLKSGVAIDRFAYRGVHRDDLIHTADIVSEAIDKGRVLMEQAAESGHVVTVPGALERCGGIFRLFHVGHTVLDPLSVAISST
jgi:hypothetical protein